MKNARRQKPNGSIFWVREVFRKLSIGSWTGGSTPKELSGQEDL